MKAHTKTSAFLFSPSERAVLEELFCCKAALPEEPTSDKKVITSISDACRASDRVSKSCRLWLEANDPTPPSKYPRRIYQRAVRLWEVLSGHPCS